MGFTDVVTGQPTLASNVNQLVDALNGTVAGQVILQATANTATPFGAYLPSAPTADQMVAQTYVSGDTNPRAAFYIRSDGYGGVAIGHGGAAALDAHLHGVSGGLKVDENLTVGGSFTSTGTATLGGLVTSGSASLDGGAITTNGSGALTVGGNLTINGAQITHGSSTTNGTNLNISRANAGEILDLSNYATPGSNIRFNLDATGAVISSDLALRLAAASFIGFKTNGGSKLAQIGAIPSHGAADMAIGGSTYWTTQPTAGYNNSASFSAFDVAEVYTTDQAYPDGTVVCSQGGVMRRCTHDGCHAAMIVSKGPGFAIGDPIAIAREAGETCELLALAGRKRVAASGGPIRERQLVTSDGKGGARAMRPGERGWTLGVALGARSADGSVGITIRAAYCEIPAN